MTHRMLVALGIALLAGGQGLAQAPVEEKIGEPRKEVSLVQPKIEAGPITVTGEPTWVECASPTQNGGRYWITADGLISWFTPTDLPPLVTTSTPKTSQGNAGVLGQPNTSILFGSSEVNKDARWGFRLAAGYWLDCERMHGLELGFLMVESQATGFHASADSTGLPILARPFTNALNNQQQAVLIAFPGSSGGAVNVQASSGNFYEMHLDFTENFIQHCGFRLDSMVGYRFYRYDEGVRIIQVVNPQGPNFVPGTRIASLDDFSAENEFHGFDLGLRAELCHHNFTLGLLAKAAAGCINHEINISGGQTTTVPGAGTTQDAAGVFALSSNIGKHRSFDWAVMPEFGATLSWQMNCHMRLHGGYSVIGLCQMARAADHIDQTLNPNLFPPPVQPLVGPSRPAFNLNLSEVWMQSINFGFEITF